MDDEIPKGKKISHLSEISLLFWWTAVLARTLMKVKLLQATRMEQTQNRTG